MEISNSKKELARIINENGGWRDGAESAAQSKLDNAISFYCDTAYRDGDCLWGSYITGGDIAQSLLLPNWHQTILSRDEYFHLYPAPDAYGWIEWGGGECPVEKGDMVDVRYRFGKENIGVTALIFRGNDGFKSGLMHNGLARAAVRWMHHGNDMDIIAYRLHKPEQAKPECCESVMRSIQEPEAKQTIEQLAADYRSAKDYADRKRQEADDAKANADVKLKELELVGEALGPLVSPITANQEPELAIEVKVGDEVECVESNIKREKYNGMVGTVLDVDDSSTPYLVNFGGCKWIWCHKVKFIRRP